MNLKTVFKYLFIFIVPSVILSFAANSVILVLSSIVSLAISKKIFSLDFLKKFLLFNAFTLVIINGFLIDMFYQNTLDFNEIIKRVSFVLMPLIFCASTAQLKHFALKTYVYFMTLVSSILLIAGLIRSVVNKNQIIYGNWNSETTENFYKSDMLLNWGELTYKRLFFYFDMHPSYYALFSVITIIIIIFTKTIDLKKTTKWLVTFIHVTMIILISSKTGIISLFIVFLFYFTIGKSGKNILFIISITMLLLLVVVKIPSTQIRLKSTYESIILGKSHIDKNSTTERLILWKSLSELSYNEIIFGLGNVGGKEKIIKSTGITKNMHNQFLQSLLNSGLIGLFLLILFVISPLFYKRSVFSLSLVSIILVNLLFENMLDRIWGITAISFFYALIIFGSSEMLNLRSENHIKLNQIKSGKP